MTFNLNQVDDDLIYEVRGMIGTLLLALMGEDNEDYQNLYFNVRVLEEKFNLMLKQAGYFKNKEDAVLAETA